MDGFVAPGGIVVELPDDLAADEPEVVEVASKRPGGECLVLKVSHERVQSRTRRRPTRSSSWVPAQLLGQPAMRGTTSWNDGCCRALGIAQHVRTDTVHTGAMSIKTILNRCHPIRYFVYGAARFVGEQIHVVVRPRAESMGQCGSCGRRGPTYDTSRHPRQFEFVPLWGYVVFLVYCMRRIDCSTCGRPALDLFGRAVSHRRPPPAEIESRLVGGWTNFKVSRIIR